MGLSNVFEQPEKPVEEKKLQVIVNEEVVFNDWMVYCEQCNKTGWSKDYFIESQQFLQSYKIKPEMISKFNEKINTKTWKLAERYFLGVFISSLIQTSYNQGFNNFEFGEVYVDHLGACLQGQKDDAIIIKAKTINGAWILSQAKNCFLEAEAVNGEFSLRTQKNCVVKIRNDNDQGYQLLRSE
ncbi:hypothetical protein HY643_00380 [Candidatus Woesearchaeota archaeon]|nr:hypothetical protein [Candidatus Woesearchaeota archaeon]